MTRGVDQNSSKLFSSRSNTDPVVNCSDGVPRRSGLNHTLNVILKLCAYTVTSLKNMWRNYIILCEDSESMKKNEQRNVKI